MSRLALYAVALSLAGCGEMQDIAACQRDVRRFLRSPASAQFSEARVAQDGTVSGVVDSQNVYGAMLRSSYACRQNGAIIINGREMN